jgi:hypothetical protein
MPNCYSTSANASIPVQWSLRRPALDGVSATGWNVGSAQALQARLSRSSAPGNVDPLYLFACQVEWRKRRSRVAAKELLCALASPDAQGRLIAEVLLEACKCGLQH